MVDWTGELNDTPETQTDSASDVPQNWRPGTNTINAMQGQTDSTEGHEWVDRGIQAVPVDQIDLSDSRVHDAGDFEKTSKAEMMDGFQKLETTVEPAVDMGAKGDYFTNLDHDQGLDPRHGYRNVYDSFYGDSAIKLDKIGDTYQVENGYHRLAVAKELGITTVPARVKEQTR